MTNSQAPRRPGPILIVSPSTRGGSWRWIREAVSAAGIQKDSVVVAYGQADEVGRDVPALVLIPFLSYERIGLWMSKHPVFIPLYNLPLVIGLYWSLFRWRPRAILANGVFLAVMCAPYARVSRTKLFLAFHAYLGGHPPWVKRLLRSALRPVAKAFVNSVGSEEDLRAVISPERICRIAHWADPVFFLRAASLRSPHGPLKVLYVGRQDEEKLKLLLAVIEACNHDPIRFTFVGDGPLAERIRRMDSNVNQLGYVDDQKKLAEVYADADILWGVADDTYVAKPVVEALASGVPVMIPDVSAVHVRADRGVRIPHDLIPPSVGWVIDGHDAAAARRLLLSVQADNLDRFESCRAYALRLHSAANLGPLVSALGAEASA
jgi:glycosyltransferase involved in cell wall biosynthesis